LARDRHGAHAELVQAALEGTLAVATVSGDRTWPLHPHRPGTYQLDNRPGPFGVAVSGLRRKATPLARHVPGPVGMV
jgi:hypothetical protein